MLAAVVGEFVPVFSDTAGVVDRVCWQPVAGATSYRIERDGRPVGTADAAQLCWTGPAAGGARYRVRGAGGGAGIDAVPSRFRVLGTTTDAESEYANDLALDAAGRAWVVTRGCTLARFDGAWRAEPIPTGCGNDGARSIAVAADQTLWMTVDDVGVVRFDPATERWWAYPGAADGGRDPLGADGLGAVWFEGPGGTILREGGAFGAITLPPRPEGCGVRSASSSPSGAVWVGTRCGLVRIGEGAPVRYDAGIPDEVAQVAVAADGVVWLRTERPHTDPLVRAIGSVDAATGAWSPATEPFGRGATLRVTDGVARVVDGPRVCTAAGTAWTCASGPDATPNGVAIGADAWLARGRAWRRIGGVWQRVNRDPPAPSATVLPLIDLSTWGGHAVAWMYARGRAWRAEDGRGLTESLDLNPLLGKPYTPELHEDASGGVWALGQRALLRRDPGGTFRAVSAPLGGGEAALEGVERGGAAWLSDTFLLARLTPEGAATTTLQAPWTRMLAGDGRVPDCVSVTLPGRGDVCVAVEATGRDAEGRPLVWTDQGLLELDATGVPGALLPTPDARVEQLGAGADGTVWAAGRSGLWLRTAADWAPLERPPKGVVTGAIRGAGGTWWLFTSPRVWSGPLHGPWTPRAEFWADPLGIDAGGGVWVEEHNSPKLVRRRDPASGRWTLPLEALERLLDADAAPSPLGGAALPEKLLLGGVTDGFVAGALAELRTEGGVTVAREGAWRLEQVR